MPGIAIGLGVGSLLAGMYSANKTAKNNAETNKLNWLRQQQMNERNYQAQKEFYQNSIQWRKQDAMNAGINPIYALGASSANFTPNFQATLDTALKDPTADNINNAISAGISAYQATDQAKLTKAQTALIKEQKGTESAKASYYTALAAKALGNESRTPTITATNAKTGETIAKTNTIKQKAFTQYEQNKNEGVIDPNSQITQEQSSDGIGVIADLKFGTKARAADEGLKRMNRGEMQYPYFERDPKENGRYILKEAHSFENWIAKLMWSKKIDYELFNILRKIDKRHPQSEEAFQQTFIKEYLDREANTY